jgi:hypothetical protein
MITENRENFFFKKRLKDEIGRNWKKFFFKKKYENILDRSGFHDLICQICDSSHRPH